MKGFAERPVAPKPESAEEVSGVRRVDRKKLSEAKPEAGKPGVMRRLRGTVEKHAFASALVVAGAAHTAALTPQIREQMAQRAHDFSSEWSKPNRVIHMQSEARKDVVRSLIRQREDRVDKQALASYKKEAEAKLERGENISFKRMYFDLERLNGVPAGEVAEAEQQADSVIQKYSTLVGTTLDQNKIKRVVEEMYGPPENYDPGQASVTAYFNTGKRNCDAIDRAQQIVFEGVLEHLPDAERTKFTVAETLVKQHVIATLVDRRGAEPRTYLLEPGIRTLEGEKPEVGSARVDADFLKKTTLSNEIVAVRAVAGKPGEVKPSPDLDFVSNQPIPRNFVVTGELKGAQFNYDEAQREGLAPQPYVDTAVNPMQVEILGELRPEVVADRIAEEEKRIRSGIAEKGVPEGSMLIAFTEDDLPPGTGAIRELARRKDHFPLAVYAESTDAWSPAAARLLVEQPMTELRLKATSEHPISQALLDALTEAGNQGRLPTKVVRIFSAESVDPKYQPMITPKQLGALTRVKGLEEIITDLAAPGKEFADAFRHSTVKRIRMEGSLIASMTPEQYKSVVAAMADSKTDFILSAEGYYNLISVEPAVLEHRNILPDFEDADVDTAVRIYAEANVRNRTEVEKLAKAYLDFIGVEIDPNGMPKNARWDGTKWTIFN